ncbi:MAG: plastocyanin/azurin family copper-binding protein [Nitrosopumilus sp.]|nr:plastocyanin/azurin family copper-binding protein [Nitrosopumilus sp.]
MKKKIIAIFPVIVLVLIFTAFFISNENPNKEESKSQITQVKADVIMPTKVSRPGCEKTNNCYIPSTIVIKEGQLATWVNEDAAFHSVTSGFYGTPTGLFDSGYLDPYQSFSFTFDESGVYDYYCTLHPWMKGQVIVE